jgi:hypothetical protein
MRGRHVFVFYLIFLEVCVNRPKGLSFFARLISFKIPVLFGVVLVLVFLMACDK